MSRSITWLIQTTPLWDPFSPTFELLTHACLALGIRCCSIDVEIGKPVVFPHVEGPVVVHGRKTLLEAARQDPVFQKGIFGDESNFSASQYQAQWGARFLNAMGEVCTILEATKNNDRRRLFIKPNDDSKWFTGKVFDCSEFKAFIENQKELESVFASQLVFTAPPVEIDAEVRLFLLDGKVISGSYYRPGLNGNISQELILFAETAAQEWQPHPVFVLDVARVDGQYRIVEANGLNGSRFYNANVIRIVDQISTYQEKVFTSNAQ